MEIIWISFQLNTERWLSDKSFISYSKFFVWKISTYFCEMKHEIYFSSHLLCNLIHRLSGHTFRRNYIQRRCRKAHLLINKTKKKRSQTHSYVYIVWQWLCAHYIQQIHVIKRGVNNNTLKIMELRFEKMRVVEGEGRGSEHLGRQNRICLGQSYKFKYEYEENLRISWKFYKPS